MIVTELELCIITEQLLVEPFSTYGLWLYVLWRNIHLVPSFCLLSSLPRTLCCCSCFLQQGRDNIICNVKELLVDLLILAEIVIPAGK